MLPNLFFSIKIINLLENIFITRARAWVPSHHQYCKILKSHVYLLIIFLSCIHIIHYSYPL